ncbi:SEC-C metal-binding domain-containing protein [Candidatus Methylomirabilis sp.]
MALTWGRACHSRGASVGRDEPCPCGSGLKAKWCCRG